MKFKKYGILILLCLLVSPMFSFSQNHFLHFGNAVNDYLTPGEVVEIANASSFTLEGWFIKSGGNLGTVFEEIGDDGVVQNIRISVTFPGNERIRLTFRENVNGSGVNYSAITPALSYVTGSWFHAAIVYDGSGATNADKVRIYINGVPQSLTFSGSGGNFPSTSPNTTAGNVPARIGINANSAGNEYYGVMDEFRIWSTARTQTEILTNKDTELTGNEAGLVIYYPFNQGVCGGSNPTVTVATNLASSNYQAVETGFSLNNCTSNWVCEGATCGYPSSGVQPIAPPSVPTLSQWGLIVLGLLVLCFGAIVVWRREYAPGFERD